MPELLRVNPDQVPAEAMEYLKAMDGLNEHELVRRHFRSVTSLVIGAPPHSAEMWLPEFRDGLNAALVWHDEAMNWGTGGWTRVAHVDGDIVCPPSPLTIGYFQNARAFASLKDVLDQLLASKPK